jgi:hypothetical protein
MLGDWTILKVWGSLGSVQRDFAAKRKDNLAK